MNNLIGMQMAQSKSKSIDIKLGSVFGKFFFVIKNGEQVTTSHKGKDKVYSQIILKR